MPLMREIDDPMRGMLRDYPGNRRFRRELFHSLPGPLMQLTGPEFYDPVYDRSAEKPASFDELAALPAYGEDKIGQLLDCLCLLVSSRQVAPVIAAESIDREPARRLNRMIV